MLIVREGSFVERLKGAGHLQLLRSTTGDYILRFLDLKVLNENNHGLYVLLMRQEMTRQRLKTFKENECEKLLLDVGILGMVKGKRTRGTFDQKLDCFEPLDYKCVVICKPAASKPPSVEPIIHLYTNLKVPQDNSTSSSATVELLEKRKAIQAIQKKQGLANNDIATQDFSLEVIHQTAFEIFDKFDKDRSGRIDFNEFQQMIQSRGILLLEPQAKRFFQYCDQDRKGELDQEEFEMALYVTNYLKSRKNGTLLIPSDAFSLFDQDQDGLLNRLEFQHALELLKVPAKVEKIQSTFDRIDVKEQHYIDRDQFKQAWITLAHEEKELQRRQVRFQTGRIFGRCLKSKQIARNKLLLLETIDLQEQEEIVEANKAKQAVLELQRKRYDQDQMVNREKYHLKQKEELFAKTEEALEARQEKIRKRKERYLHMKRDRDEKRRRAAVEREEKERTVMAMDAKMEAMRIQRQDEVDLRQEEYQDIVSRTDQGLTKVPDDLYKGRRAMYELSTLLAFSLARNAIQHLPPNLCYNLDQLQRLDLSDNELIDLPEEIGQLADLKICRLAKNRLGKLPSTFGHLKQLEILDLSFNRLEEITAVSELTKLFLFQAIENEIETLPDDIGQLKHLQTISLRGNALTQLPESFGELQALRHVDFSSNRLVQLCPMLNGLENLLTLNLEYNRLRQLPHSISNLKQLQSLNLGFNSLIAFPTTIGDLTSLMEFKAPNNRLRLIPDEIGNALALEYIDWNTNHLKSLPSSIGRLKQLKSFNLRNNKLISLPLEIGALTELIDFDLGYNQLQVLEPEFGFISSLERCNLSFNSLTTLPSSFNQFQLLEKLELQSNSLVQVDQSLQQLYALEILDLSHNLLTTFPLNLCHLPSLQQLKLTANRLRELPSEISHMTSLQHLDLYNNRLESLPRSAASLFQRLDDQIHLGKNPLMLHQHWAATVPETRSLKPEPIVKDWIQDQAVLYSAIQNVWERFSRSKYLVSGDPNHILHFETQVRDEIGQERWLERYKGVIRMNFWRLKRVGTVFRIDDVSKPSRMKDLKTERSERSEKAIEQDKIRIERVKEKYSVDFVKSRLDFNFKKQKAMKRMQQERQEEIEALNQHVREKAAEKSEKERQRQMAYRKTFVEEARTIAKTREVARRDKLGPEEELEERYRWELYHNTGYLINKQDSDSILH